MRTTDTLLFIHLLGVFALISGVAIEIILVTHALKATTCDRLAALLAPLKVLPFVFGAAALILLGAGASLVHRESVKWSSGWVDVAIILLVSLSAIAPNVWGKPLEAIHQRAEAAGSGPVPADLAADLRRPSIHLGMRMAWCEVVAALFVMSEKPGWVGAIVTVVVAAAAGAGLAQLGTKQAA